MTRPFRLLAFMAAMLVLVNGASAQSKFLRGFRSPSSFGVTGSLPPSNSISQSVLDGQTLWIGTNKGVAASTDLGQHWTSYRHDAAFANDGIYALAANGPLVWAATGYDKDVSDGTVQTGSGYAVSTDNGTTWHHLPQALDQRGDSIMAYGINDSLRILPVVVPEQSVTFDISLAESSAWVAGWASGLRRTTDNGATWKRILLPSDVQSTIAETDTLWFYEPTDTLHLRRIFQKYDVRRANNYLAFSVLAINDSLVWCGTAGGVNLSTDAGRSWRKFSHQNQAQPILGNWVIAVAEQQYQTLDRIWTTNWRADDPAEDYGISYTDDGGATWKNVLRGVKAYAFAFNPSNGAVYIASDDGVYRTADGGATFSLASSITDPARHRAIVRPSVYTIAVKGDTVLVGTSDGLAWTLDNINAPFGQTWNILRTFSPLAGTTETYSYPNPFSPTFQVSRIHYAIAPGSAGVVTVDVFDFGLNRVRTLLHDAQHAPGREYDEIWDGRRDDGSLVANGVYFYRVKIDDQDPLNGKILVLQ